MERYVTSTSADGVHIISEGDERKLVATVRAPRELAQQMAVADELYEALEKCREVFADYAEIHRRKLTRALCNAERSEILRKIERNRDMADLCIAVLAKSRGEQG